MITEIAWPSGAQAGRATLIAGSRMQTGILPVDDSRLKHRRRSVGVFADARTKAITRPFGENEGRLSTNPSPVSWRAVCGLSGFTTQMLEVLSVVLRWT